MKKTLTRMEKAANIRILTSKDLKRKLKKHGRCAVVRPTGFGKTCLGTDLTRQYNSTLYCYPTQVIRTAVEARYWEEEDAVDEETMEMFRKLNKLPNVTLMTYAKLQNLDVEEMRNMHFDLVIFDECHRLGGKKTNQAAKKLVQLHPKTHFVGLTATPIRTDGYDVIEDPDLFNNVEVFPYTLHEAFQDGILLKPYYCYCTYEDANTEAHTDFRDAALMAGEDINNPSVVEVYNRSAFLAADLLQMEKNIKTVCDEYAPDTTRMKFIVFFSNIEHLHNKELQVEEWFRKAYPDLPVRTLHISSETKEYAENTNELATLSDFGINLIFAIDMMNMGYHVDDLTGIVMYRTTISDIIFIQQLGRVLSTGSNCPGIVFDVVDNLHRKGVFFESENIPKSAIREKDLDDALYDLYTEINQEELAKKKTLLPDAVADVAEPDTEAALDTVTLHTERKSSRKMCNALFEGDLIAVGNFASYRELIAKTVAEPIAYRAVVALNMHFRTWCRVHGMPYPITQSDMINHFGKTKRDFVKDFLKAIKKGADVTGYPIHSAKQLKQIGKKVSEELTIAICAEWQNVKVKNIMTLLGL